MNYIVSVPQLFITKKLQLRPPDMKDAEEIFKGLWQDPEVSRYLLSEPSTALEDTVRFLRECIAAWKTGMEYSWIICKRGSRHPLGMISARPSGGPTVEIGFVLAQHAWGQGVMTEAAKTLVEWWYSQPAIDRVEAYCDANNIGSMRVLTKAGLIREGLLLKSWIPQEVTDPNRNFVIFGKTKVKEPIDGPIGSVPVGYVRKLPRIVSPYVRLQIDALHARGVVRNGEGVARYVRVG